MSLYPNVTAGIAVTSALLQAMIDNVVRKANNQSVTSSTTLVNDTALLIPVAANATYLFQLELFYEGAAGSGDIKVGWAVPVGTTMTYRTAFADTSLIARWGYGTQATVSPFGGNGGSAPLGASVFGSVVTSGTAGNLQLQWAQNTSNATATQVVAGSLLIARRIA